MANAEDVKARIQLVRDLSNELAAYLHTLPERIWRNADDYPSPCEGWMVADVITHLILGANSFSQSIESALKGVASPPLGYTGPLHGPEALELLVQTREAFYEDLFYEFNAGCLRLNSTLVSLEPEAYELKAWHTLLVTPSVAQLIDIRASELAVHGWDVRFPMDRSATLSPKAVPFLKDEFLLRWLYTGFQRGETLREPIRFRFRLTDGDAEGYDVAVTGDKFRLEPSDGTVANVTFVSDTDTFILFCMGRLSLNRSVRRRRIILEGDAEMAGQFGDWFRGV